LRRSHDATDWLFEKKPIVASFGAIRAARQLILYASLMAAT
jgi:hypothetical protein